jgi:hypothetical protein
VHLFPDSYYFLSVFSFSPIRSLIESGFSADKRSDVRLYYGARNVKRMAYQVCLHLITFYGIYYHGITISCLVGFEPGASSSYRIGLKIGNLLVLKLCQCYHNQVAGGLVKLAMYRWSVHTCYLRFLMCENP